jgi:hypothetical protein
VNIFTSDKINVKFRIDDFQGVVNNISGRGRATTAKLLN